MTKKSTFVTAISTLTPEALRDRLGGIEPVLADDGVWEVRVLLEEPEAIFSSVLRVPLPYRRIDESLVNYVDDQLTYVPKNAPFRLVFYLDNEILLTIGTERLEILVDYYWRERAKLRRKAERNALNEVFRAFLWGVFFMLACQVIRWFATFPDYPTLTQTISEGLLVLGWVALWNPYDSFLFSWWPAHRARRRTEALLGTDVDFRSIEEFSLFPDDGDRR